MLSVNERGHYPAIFTEQSWSVRIYRRDKKISFSESGGEGGGGGRTEDTVQNREAHFARWVARRAQDSLPAGPARLVPYRPSN